MVLKLVLKLVASKTPLFPLFVIHLRAVYSHNENKGGIYANSLIINDDDIAKLDEYLVYKLSCISLLVDICDGNPRMKR